MPSPVFCMHVFLYEWITGGALVDEAGRLPASMLAEGSAMIQALAADFAAIEGCRVSVFRDIRLTDLPLPEQLAHFRRQGKIASFLSVKPNMSYHFVTADGDLRTLPCHLPDPDPRFAGLDGFYVARMVRS